MIIFLNGYSGVGKSYWGEKMSLISGFPHLDLDGEIEKKYQKRITEIFSEWGENTFRGIEFAQLNQIVKSNHEKLIVSLGGGTACNQHVINLIKSIGIVIYLKTDFSYFQDQIEQLLPYRPRLKTLFMEGGVPKIRQDWEARQHWYVQSQLHFEVKSTQNLLKSSILTNLLTR
jgi:shikimate kinase